MPCSTQANDRPSLAILRAGSCPFAQTDVSPMELASVDIAERQVQQAPLRMVNDEHKATRRTAFAERNPHSVTIEAERRPRKQVTWSRVATVIP